MKNWYLGRGSEATKFSHLKSKKQNQNLEKLGIIIIQQRRRNKSKKGEENIYLEIKTLICVQSQRQIYERFLSVTKSSCLMSFFFFFSSEETKIKKKLRAICIFVNIALACFINVENLLYAPLLWKLNFRT